MQTPVSLSVIIVNRNRRELLRRCLESLQAQQGIHLELIVVDNGSTDRSNRMVQTAFPSVRLLRNRSNLGAAFARNQGVLASSGDLLWFVDNDSECPHSDVARHLAEILDREAEIGIVGGERTRREGNATGLKGFDVRINGEAVPRVEPAHEAHPMRFACDYVDTLNCAIRRRDFFAIGGFDPEYVYLAEDKDLGEKIRQLGLKVIADSRVALWHARSAEERPRPLAYLYQLERNRLRFALLNYPPARLLRLPVADLTTLASYRRVLLAGLRWWWQRALTIAAAYVWNLFRLHRTLRTRRLRPDFLKETAHGLRPVR